MNNFTKSSLLALTLLGTSFAMTPAFAADENNVAPGMTYAGAPLGLHGSDPVALLNGTQVDGNPQHFAAHEGVAYYFTTADNKAAFEAEPAKYMPQNGGFCTLGVAFSKKLDGNPEYSAVVDGKLYVFLNGDVLEKFKADQAGMITSADENWVTIRSTAAADL